MQQILIPLFLMSQCCLITCHLYEYYYIRKAKNWSEAQQYCRRKYTDLATVSNMSDMTRLQELALKKTKSEEAWIGLYNKTDSNRTWHWSLPGVEYNEKESNWKEGEPNDKGKSESPLENCVAINKNLLWADFPCEYKKKPFLCYDESKASEKFCLITKEKTFSEAQKYCRVNHTDLVSGLHQLQDEELRELVNGYKKNGIFIGLFRDTWRWSDGSGFSFRQWDSEPIGAHNAVAFENKILKTHDGKDKKHFFCYEDKVILIKKKMNWEDALYNCRDYHHDLVTITSLDEQRWVQEKAKKANTPFVWTGLRYTCTLDFWFWVSDEEVRYKNWASGQDRNDCDMSGAMETGGKHKWFKKNDNDEFNFICSKS